MMIAIVDYGVGNLRSVQKALERVGATAIVTANPADLDTARGIVLPGVGAFGDGMEHLRARGLVDPVLQQVDRAKPLLGICLGMQLLFEESEEMGHHQGLGLLPGQVVRFPEGELKVPHIGWNQLHKTGNNPARALLAGVTTGAYAYFVHSYYAQPDDASDIVATTEYGPVFASVVGRDRIFGAQFHPEKSQEVGLRLLQNYARVVGEPGVGEDR
jgi:glutamine amidotransferase